MQVDDRVAYSHKFLNSIQCYSGDTPQMRGTVTRLQKYGDREFVDIQWDSDPPGETHKCFVGSIAKTNSVGFWD